MIRQWLQILLVLGLLLPGVVAVGADTLPDGGTEHPCDDGAMSAACAAHCLTTQAPGPLILPATPPAHVMHVPPPDGAIPNPSYVPSLPPPIA